MTTLTGTGLRCEFGALAAVDGVDLSIEHGARHAVIGPNGAGKTTLFRLLSGASRATAGRVELAGRVVTRLSEPARTRLGLAQTFQHSSLFESLTGHENVALAAQRHSGHPWWPLPHRQRRVGRTVEELLARVGLAERAGDPAGELSHGERRHLELAVALACQPRVLLLDEPAAGMAPAESDRFAELIEALPAELTVAFVEHDLDLVFRLADQVTVLHLGRVLASGRPEQVRTDTAVQQAYLGTGDRTQLFTGPQRGGADVAAGA